MSAADDDWGDVFAAAEGKSTATQIINAHDTATDNVHHHERCRHHDENEGETGNRERTNQQHQRQKKKKKRKRNRAKQEQARHSALSHFLRGRVVQRNSKHCSSAASQLLPASWLVLQESMLCCNSRKNGSVAICKGRGRQEEEEEEDPTNHIQSSRKERQKRNAGSASVAVTGAFRQTCEQPAAAHWVALNENGLSSGNDHTNTTHCRKRQKQQRIQHQQQNQDDNNGYYHYHWPHHVFCLLWNFRAAAKCSVLYPATATRSRKQENQDATFGAVLLDGEEKNKVSSTLQGQDFVFHLSASRAEALRKDLQFFMLQRIPAKYEQLISKFHAFQKTALSWLALFLAQHQYHHQQQKQKPRSPKERGSSSSTTERSFSHAIRLIMACDAVYYQLYYLQITNQLEVELEQDNIDTVSSNIPHPTTYFGSIHNSNGFCKKKHFVKVILSQLEGYNGSESLDLSSSSKLLEELQGRYGFDNDPTNEHPLSAIHHYRFLEGISLFHETGWMYWSTTQREIREELSVAGQKTRSTEDCEHEVVAAPILTEWRDSSRDFLCHLYAYATLPQCFLPWIQNILTAATTRHSEATAAVDSVVELGAGTGYMAYHWQEQTSIPIQVFDEYPTAHLSSTNNHCYGNRSAKNNEYHGSTPAFVHVEKGNTSTLLQMRKSGYLQNKALLLSYPPPGKMAFTALQSFGNLSPSGVGGNVLVHIGEFKGTTGSGDFERVLLSDYSCLEDRLPCLTWGTDAAEVTVWKRKDKKAQSSFSATSLLLPCCHCKKKESTKRCRLLRYLNYCSLACFDAHRVSRQLHLNMAFVHLDDKMLDFNNKDHFSSLERHW